MYVRLAQALYGDGSSDAQLAHAGFLALLMCNIVGVYWMLRSLKDSVFTTVVGIAYQVWARVGDVIDLERDTLQPDDFRVQGLIKTDRLNGSFVMSFKL